ncbi:hypothetical protein [Bacillus proteolyticus]|uniref:hypothetical protein n=1 Tax=Bacillus proteolyticus TaxID=2026192 RepID=UPI0030F496DA
MNLTKKQLLLTIVIGIMLFFVITFFTIFTIVSELKYDHPNSITYSFTKTLVWFFYLFVLVTIISFIVALVKLKNKKTVKKTFIVTGLTFLVSISLFFGIGLIALNLQEVNTTTASKTFTEKEVDKIIDDYSGETRQLKDQIEKLNRDLEKTKTTNSKQTQSNNTTNDKVDHKAVFAYMKEQYKILTNNEENYIPEIHDPQVADLAAKRFGISAQEAGDIYVKTQMDKFR